MAKAELTTVENFKIVTGMEAMDEELRAELEDELDDLDDDGGIDAKHIKIPSGGGKAFEVETDDPDDPEVMKEVTGVIIFTHRMNAYWAQKFGEAGEDGNINKSPDCSSMDGKQGVNRETGEIRTCDTCPYNQFGSDGKGKACKNMRRLYIMMNNRPDIYLLTVPPTSIKDVNKALKKIMGQQHIPYSRMIVTFKLNVVENADKIKYSKVTLEKTGLLPEALYKTTAELRKAMKQSYESVAITTDDYKEAAPIWFAVRRMFSWQGNNFIQTYFDEVDDPMNNVLVQSVVDSENIRCSAYAPKYWAGASIEYKSDDNPKTAILAGTMKFRQHIAPYTPAQEIVDIIDYDTDTLAAAVGGN